MEKATKISSNFAKRVVVLILGVYRVLVSPALFVLFGKGCRYKVTCSEFAKKSIESLGVIKGGKISLKRLSTCHY